MGLAVPDMGWAALRLGSMVIHCSMSYVVDGVDAGVGGGASAGGGGAEVGLGVGLGVGVGEGLDGMGWLATRSLLAEGAPGNAGLPHPIMAKRQTARRRYFM